MSHRPPVLELLAVLARVLRSRGIRWYLFGAQAVIVWGRPRMSADVDVTVELSPADTSDFVRTMREAGFELRIEDPENFVARTRALPFLHRSTRMPLDVVLAGPGLEEQFLERARPVALEGLTVPVMSPEDLVVTKILAGRPKDLEDFRGIVQEQRETLDASRVREVLDLLEQALTRADLMPVFEAEMTKLGL